MRTSTYGDSGFFSRDITWIETLPSIKKLMAIRNSTEKCLNAAGRALVRRCFSSKDGLQTFRDEGCMEPLLEGFTHQTWKDLEKVQMYLQPDELVVMLIKALRARKSGLASICAEIEEVFQNHRDVEVKHIFQVMEAVPSVRKSYFWWLRGKGHDIGFLISCLRFGEVASVTVGELIKQNVPHYRKESVKTEVLDVFRNIPRLSQSTVLMWLHNEKVVSHADVVALKKRFHLTPQTTRSAVA